MPAPAIPEDEAERLRKLHALNILYTPANCAFDEVVRLARIRFGMPLAAVSLIDAGELWCKAIDGSDIGTTPREFTLCGHAILADGMTVVEDTQADERFADNPAVAGPPHFRFYAGYPMRIGSGSALGMLCILDLQPRRLSDEEVHGLEKLGRIAENLLRNHTLQVELATEVLLGTDLASRRELVDPLTGNWKTAALQPLLECHWQSETDHHQLPVLLGVRVPGDPGDWNVRMETKEAARKMRAALPDRSLHFHDERGGLMALATVARESAASGVLATLAAELSAPAGWDLLGVEPPGLQPQLLASGGAPQDAAAAAEGFLADAAG